MGRDFVGVWTGLHPLFAFLFGGDSCCFCCCPVFDFGFCPKRDFVITAGDTGGCRGNGGFHYRLSFGLLDGGLGCTGSRFAEKVALYWLFSGEDAERRLPRFRVIWVRSSAVNSKRSYRLNTGGEKRESSISSFGSGVPTTGEADTAVAADSGEAVPELNKVALGSGETVFGSVGAGFSVRHFLEDKERQMCQIVQILEQQQAINDKITRQVPVIVQKSVQEQPKKSKRKGFLGIFGKKEEAKPTATTTMLRSLNRNMIAEQQAQSCRLSEHADSLATRNAELNRQLQGLVVQMDEKVQADIQKREAEITAMREQSFIQIGGLTGFVVLLLIISYIIIHRNITRIKRYKRETADLIEQLKQSVEQNEALIASRKKAVHTITHELRTPLTAITGYAGLVRKDCNTDKIGMYIQNIQQSSERMREMLNTLLSFFRLDNGKEQPNISPCRISAIIHTLETEFMPIAMNKGLALIVTNHTDAVVLTDKERILQIGNNLLSNAIKFTEDGSVSMAMGYDDGMLKLIVEDTGTGMTEEEQQRVFGAFERLSNAAARMASD